MTMTADRTTTQLGSGDARDTLLEMAAVIRTVFGVGLESSRRATATVAAEAEAPQVAVAPAPPAYAAPASIPMPGLPPVATQQTPSVPEAPTPYAGEVPALRVVPNPQTSLDDVHPEHRQAVLREVAFLDD
jgi:hypothetical protein